MGESVQINLRLVFKAGEIQKEESSQVCVVYTVNVCSSERFCKEDLLTRIDVKQLKCSSVLCCRSGFVGVVIVVLC